MKKFLAGVISTILIVCIVFVTITITKMAVKNPINEVKDQITNQFTKSDSVEITPDPTTLVKELKQLKRLESASLKINQVYNATRDNKRLWGILGEELSFVANGEVVAGIDLSSIDESSFRVLNSSIIEITVPKAQIFNVVIDNNTSYITSRNRGLFASFDSQLETNVRAYAQNDFEKIALNSTLLFDAFMNATDYIQEITQKLGFTVVVFKIDS